MKVLTRAKHAVEGWLNALAESNQKQFGGKKMDCCEINRKANDKAVHGSHDVWEQSPQPRKDSQKGQKKES